MTQTNKVKEKIMLEFINDKGNKLRITPTELVEWINRVKEQQKQHKKEFEDMQDICKLLIPRINELRRKNQELKDKLASFK